jgi:hypothetical protein
MREGIYVCDQCIEDPDLKQTIQDNAESAKCSFCGTRSRTTSVCAFDAVISHIRQSIEESYDDAADWLPFESAEGGYIGEYWDTYDLVLDEIGLELPKDRSGRLFNSIVDALPDRVWCNKYPMDFTPSEEVSYSWKYFSSLVKHKRRFFFITEPKARMAERQEFTPPQELLAKIVRYSGEHGLFRALPSGTVLYRARKQRRGRRLKTASDLGPPPEEKATRPNRMSPSGIVMFYASLGPDTALSEIAEEGRGIYVIGRFRTLHDLKILDLTEVENEPGFFFQLPDSAERDPRPALRFLGSLCRQISQPINRDGTESIEYVPTQIVSEYLRTVALPDGGRVDGILYPSTTHEQGRSIVLFATQDDVKEIVDDRRMPIRIREPWLSFLGSSSRKVT